MQLRMTITLGEILTIFSILVTFLSIWKAIILPLRRFLLVHLEEHDLMWEDYTKRYGIHYAARRGRGYINPDKEKIE